MEADVLSDVLSRVRLNGAVFFDFELSSPWVAEAPPSREIAGQVLPGAQRVIEFHLIARGSCWGHVVGQEPIRLREGDLLAFPQGDAHVLSSAPGLRARPDASIYDRTGAPLPLYQELGGGGAEGARIVCCFLGCDDRPFNPLLSALPAVIHISATRRQASAERLATLLGIAASEARHAGPGSQNFLSRLAELIFVETLRQHLESLPETQSSWLAGLRDPLVCRALAALHGDPRAAWTVERLARQVGVSRSVLAERFAEMAGHPPMQYLTLWRMQLAAHLLAEGTTVAAVASAVGYESEAAFSRAFKNLVGQAPASWRRASPAAPRRPLP